MVSPEVWLKWQVKVYGRFLEKPSCERTLLDVGCGDGEFLKQAKDRGYVATGIDLNRILVSKIKQKYDLDIHAISIEDFVEQFPEKKFDIVTFFQVLEHMVDPDHFMSLIKSRLNNRGCVALSVPNRNRFELDLKRFPKWDSPPHHYTWWSKKSLKKFLIARGLKVLDLVVFKKEIELEFRSRDSKDKYPGLIKRLPFCGMLKYFSYKNIIAPILLGLKVRRVIHLKITVQGPYLYALAMHTNENL